MRVNHRAIWLAGVLGLILCLPNVLEAQTLMWDPSPSTGVTGYRVWSGQVSGVYNSQTDVGNVTSYRPLGLDWTKHQFFAVQAYNASGLASALTAEVEWIPSITTLTSLTSNGVSPLLMGRSVTWTATGSNNLGPAEFEFWLFGRAGWAVAQAYGPSNTFTWTPGWDDQGSHYLQVRARAVGATVAYEAVLGSNEFLVNTEQIALAADTDFPTPPGNPVSWTATIAGAGTTPLEYKFWVLNPTTGWATFRDWSAANTAVWTPGTTGTYAVQAWARRVGSTAQYDLWVSMANLVVSRTAPTITSLAANRPFPVWSGTPITWTARSRGGTSGPVEYQFWLYTASTGWRIAQPYGPSKTFTWTPSWADAGTPAVQVWVRSAGSNPAAGYEDYRSTGFFEVQRAPLHLTTSALFPVAPGTPIQWSASVEDPNVNLNYQFWVYSQNTSTWSIAQAYSTTKSFVWTPSAGTYAIQVWVKEPGSVNAYDDYRGTTFLTVAASPAVVVSLTADVTLPATTGTTITWTAGATGGTGPLQYQFWRFDSATGWTIVQPYGSSRTYSWTPSAGDAGTHALQVWVRSPGSTAAAGYDSYMSSGFFTIR